MAKIDVLGYSESLFGEIATMQYAVDINFTTKEVFDKYLKNGFDPNLWERTNGNGNKVLVEGKPFFEEGKKNDNGKLPYHIVLFQQFPLALREVIKCSSAGHEKYKETDTDWQNFSRLDNANSRYKNASLRHMTETGIVDDMKQYGEMTHEGAVIWNLLADLEIKLRNNE